MTGPGRLLRIARDARPAASDGDLLGRYVRDRDEAAFAELVRRNGPLVLRACRSVLGEASAAEDAFQATFLVLVRKASRLPHPAALAGWLHATAVRVAREARRADARARRREARVAGLSEAGRISPDDLTWREVRELIDAELAALPETYRLPLVLCYLQELSYDEAAARAGCSVGALRGRLERGKEQLRKRLARHGLPLALPLLALGPPAAVSAAVEGAALSTVRAATTGGRISPAVAALAGLRGGFRVALLAPAFVLAALGVVLAGSVRPPADPPPAARLARADPPPRTDHFGDPLPDGAVMRLGTTRGRAAVAGFGFAPDGTVVAVSPTAEVTFWSANGDRPTRTVQLPTPNRGTYLPLAAISPDARFVAAYTAQTKMTVWERAGTEFKEVRWTPLSRPKARSSYLLLGAFPPLPGMHLGGGAVVE